MKKTLITLLALSGLAFSAETPSPVITLSGNSINDISDKITGNAITLAVNLDFEKAKSLLLADTATMDSFVQFGAALNVDGNGIANNSIGAAICHSNNSAIRGTWNGTTWNNGTPNGFQIGMDLGAFDNLSWDLASTASFVLTYSYDGVNGGSSGVTGIFTLGDAQGNVLNQIGGTYSTGLKSSTMDINYVKFSDTVKFAHVYNEGVTVDSAKIIGQSALVPEPTTATLSLFALAGLAARRRRK